VLGQHRSTQRKRPAARDKEPALVKRMRDLVARHPRYGYRRLWALLRAEGWRVNRKRVFRLWRQQGLSVPRKQRKKRRLGASANSCVRHRARGKGHVWAWDFIHARTADGRPRKWLSVVDEYTRECLALEVGRRMKAAGGAVPGGLVRQRGVPGHIRGDNGPEFIAQAIREWLTKAGVGALYSAPAAPWENGYAESFHGKLRDELLEREEFASLLAARGLARTWKEEYITARRAGDHAQLLHDELVAFSPADAAGAVRRELVLRRQEEEALRPRRPG
jgi:transposase InsO family protein